MSLSTRANYLERLLNLQAKLVKLDAIISGNDKPEFMKLDAEAQKKEISKEVAFLEGYLKPEKPKKTRPAKKKAPKTSKKES